jgi:ATP:ADP antiporter, AAA family
MNDRERELRGAARIAVIAAVTVIAGFVTSKAARDAILLSSFSIEQLPLFVGVSAALSLPIVLVAGRLFVRFSPDRLLPVLNLISAALLIGEWLLAQDHPDVAAVVVFLHLGSFGAVLVSGFWSIVNERFDVRTAKRYVGRIGVGATLGGILGGIIAERTAVHLEPNMILLVLAILQGISALVLRVLAGHEQRHHEPTVEALAPLASLRTIANSALLRNLGIVVVLGAVGAAALDYVFKMEVVAASKNGPLRMLAIYHLGTSIVTALMQILAAQPVLRALGVARTVGTLPATVTGVGLAAVFMPGLYPAMIARGAEAIMRSSIYRAGYELLYAPLPEHEKRSAKVVIDVGAERIGDLLGAQLVALILYFAVDPRMPVLIAATGIGVVAFAFASRVPRAYTIALEHSLLEQARHDEANPPSPDSSSPLRWTSLGEPTMSETGGDLTALSLLGLNVAQIREAAADAGNAEPIVREVIMPSPKKTRAARTSGLARPVDLPNAGDSIRRDPTLDQITGLRSRNISRVREILETELTPDLVPHILPLVAWDEVAPAALRALVQLAPRCTGTIVDALLDGDRDFTIRRRLPAVLTAGDPALAAWALWRAMTDTRFEVRYRAGRALLELRHADHELPFTADEAYELVEKELSVERTVLKNYRLLDSDPQLAKAHGAEPLATVSSSTALAHVFNLLALALPPEPVRIAFQSLHTQDYELRATALEYLESALPTHLSEKLWPLIDVEQAATPTRKPRKPEDLVAALRMSQPVIEAKLAALTDKS